MKISEGISLQKSLNEEIARIKDLCKDDSVGRYYPREEVKDLKFVKSFDIEEGHNKIKKLSKLQRKLSTAISKANWSTDLAVDEADYVDWV